MWHVWLRELGLVKASNPPSPGEEDLRALYRELQLLETQFKELDEPDLIDANCYRRKAVCAQIAHWRQKEVG